MAMKFEKKSEGLYMLDVTGYVCPHPQIYTKKALEKMKNGDIVELIFDNPSSSESIAAMCEAQGNEIVEKSMVNGKYLWKVKKTADVAAAVR
jgi:tRNA 2-thiouridine synthesizing protein A